MQYLRTIQPVVEVPTKTTAIDQSNPTVLKLIEQGGVMGALLLVAVLLWLLIKLVKAVKED